MITSPTNPKLRYVRRLDQAAFRAREGRLLLEGVRLIGDAVGAGIDPSFVLVAGSAEAMDRTATLRERLAARGVPVLEVEPRLLAEVAQTQTSQGILAVAPLPDLPMPVIPGLVLVVDGLRDPGNLGTLLRSAAAAGVDAVLLGPGTVDSSNPKVVRAAMGAHFRVPICALGWAEIAEIVRRPVRPLRAWVADVSGALDYTAVDWTAPSALIVGGEAHGPSPEARALADATVRIPMPGPVESLNAATAGAVVLFEAVRQASARQVG